MPNNVGDKGHHNASSAVQPSTTDQLVDAIYQTSDGVAADLAAERTADEIATVRTQAVNAYTSTEALREALADELVWHEAAEKALSKQPPSGDRGWRRAEHQERIDAIRAALSGSPAPSAEGLRALARDCDEIIRNEIDKMEAEYGREMTVRDMPQWLKRLDTALGKARTALAGITVPSEVDGK